MKVLKRDGRIKEYDLDRIHKAILNSYKDVYSEISNKHCEDIKTCMTNIENYIQDNYVTPYHVEDIQDVIIDTIAAYGDFEVSKHYEEYRMERTNIRDSKSDLVNSIMGLVDSTNIEVLTENSNKQSELVSTVRDLMAGEVSKYISKTKIVPKHLINAHNKGIIKIHDLDYLLNPLTNCELVDIEDMLQNGTVINKKKIDKPKSLRTAMTLVTQIAAQVASSTYGGQTITLSHISPFIRISKDKITTKYENMNLPIDDSRLEELIMAELKDEIRDSVQTFNYQVSTLMTTNGQAPFISVCMYISENPEYEEETAMLIEEFLHQRITGMKNEYNVIATQTFPKLLYFMDDNNSYKGDKYFWLTELAARSTALRMNPDIISVKKMKEVIGHAFPPMGCRAFLSPFEDSNGDFKFYGRGNLGVCTVNLPYAALESKGDVVRFIEILDDHLEYAREIGELRYNKLKGVKASVAPILWQHGALARLNADDDITKAIDEKGFTVTIGYSGLYETVKYLTGESHTDGGSDLALFIMSYLQQKCKEFKDAQPHLRFALYGTPQESTTGWFNDKLKKEFGVIKDITDKGWITNSYHVDIRENIDAFTKLDKESKLMEYSTGGAVSYVEVNNLQRNIPAVIKLFQHMYETIIYSEINFESDVCGKCGYTGMVDINLDTLKWVCPQCKNDDQTTLSVVRRTCGYLGETVWTEGRIKDIVNRVKHL